MILLESIPQADLTTTLNTLGLLGIALLQAFAMWRNKVRQDKSQVKMAEVSKKQDEIHSLINGPLGMALAALATAQESVARMTRNEGDILAAVASRKASDEHNANQAKAASEKKLIEDNKEKIIKEFLGGQK